MGKENLVPISERTSEELHEMTVKGGKASGVARRKKKAMREQLEMLLKLPVVNNKTKSKIQDLGIDEKEIDNQMALTIALYQKALNGDTKAYEIIRDTIGEKPIEQVLNLNPPVINVERPKE